tara:strand:- start:366 stop:707 length:342 start_codon:yes stop_codon:yes gene_type:complete
MVKKTTKANTKLKTTKKKTSTRKKQVEKKENSFGITLLIVGGLILLIYFASNIEANVEVSIESGKNATQEEVVDQKIIISGKTYASKKAAMEQLQFLPQSRLTEEEIQFVESY